MVVIGQPGVGTGGEKLLSFQLGQHGGATRGIEQGIADVAGQYAERRGQQQEPPAIRIQAIKDIAGEIGTN